MWRKLVIKSLHLKNKKIPPFPNKGMGVLSSLEAEVATSYLAQDDKCSQTYGNQ